MLAPAVTSTGAAQAIIVEQPEKKSAEKRSHDNLNDPEVDAAAKRGKVAETHSPLSHRHTQSVYSCIIFIFYWPGWRADSCIVHRPSSTHGIMLYCPYNIAFSDLPPPSQIAHELRNPAYSTVPQSSNKG
jgi:hypothetical protein